MRGSLDELGWRRARSAHEHRVAPWVESHLRRRSVGRSHPVEDFLFTYYQWSPASLRRWHPGYGVRLLGDVASFASLKGYVVTPSGAEVEPGLALRRGAQVRTIRRLLAATASRQMALSCFGLHEWAMVYRQPPDQLRHPSYPLRLGTAGTDAVVEAHRISCTHHDAYRFFTNPARPRNTLQPSRERQHEDEQPGCLHATMDLYKWAYRLHPFISADLVADCFALAHAVRLVDMRAAPYDLSGLGVEPIAIETAAGKAEYTAHQRRFATAAGPLRDRLIAHCDSVLAAAD